jgi:hypothetical protein
MNKDPVRQGIAMKPDAWPAVSIDDLLTAMRAVKPCFIDAQVIYPFNFVVYELVVVCY